jgi:hypothetical protein
MSDRLLQIAPHTPAAAQPSATYRPTPDEAELNSHSLTPVLWPTFGRVSRVLGGWWHDEVRRNNSSRAFKLHEGLSAGFLPRGCSNTFETNYVSFVERGKSRRIISLRRANS